MKVEFNPYSGGEETNMKQLVTTCDGMHQRHPHKPEATLRIFTLAQEKIRSLNLLRKFNQHLRFNLKESVRIWFHRTPRTQTKNTLRKSNPDLPSGCLVLRTKAAGA